MAFHLPSVSDAKKQQEHLAPKPTSNVQQQQHMITHPNGSINDHAASSNSITKIYPPKGNPYAKRKQPISFTDTVKQSQTSIIPGNASANVTQITTSISRHTVDSISAPLIPQKDGQGIATIPKATTIPAYTQQIPIVDPNTTFSQAFNSIEHSTCANQNERIRAEQVSFEQQQQQQQQSIACNINSMRDNQMSLQTHVLHVSNRQRGNGILRYIRNVPFNFSDIVPDFITSPNRCQLFLSFKYHCLHPTYIHRRISELRSDFDLRVLLCLVDVDDNASILFSLNKLCVVNNMTLMLAWSEEECARYLETFKTLENNNGSIIQRREQVTFVDQITDTLTSIKSVNKTDAVQLMGHCTSILGIARTPIDQLGLIPGLGPKKVRRIYDAFHKPFTHRIRKDIVDQKDNSVEVDNAEDKSNEIADNGGSSVQVIERDDPKHEADEDISIQIMKGDDSNADADDRNPIIHERIKDTVHDE